MVTLAALSCELRDWLDPALRTNRLTGWLSGTGEDWLPFLPVLLIAPLFAWGLPHTRQRPAMAKWQAWLALGPATSSPLSALMCFFLLAVSGGWLAWRLGLSQQGLPPAYHDEYSYLLQAQTFLAGRVWFPSFSPQPELFDQMHVLNEGRFASRYFPGMGMWLAPFVALGNPWRAQHVAQGLCCGLLFLSGRRLSSNGVGLLAGLLFAVSPGMILFSNLLLAHHPTLVGLLLFLWMYLRWRDSQHPGDAVLAGTGLAWAMLCRPMTAAGFALPMGIEFALWWLPARSFVNRLAPGSVPGFAARTRAAAALGGPLVVGLVGMMIYNSQITGSLWVSPYQQYTDLYTPRHVYGFDNVIRGERHLGPRLIDNYDRWAQNLTPELAARNEQVRWWQSCRWTLGIVPLLLGVTAALPSLRPGGWRLVAASILSLHVAHVPYWFEGIMGWHYVLETAPLLLLLFAQGSSQLWTGWRQTGPGGLRWWWLLLMLVGVAANLVTVQPVWRGRLPAGMAELRYARDIYARFRAEVELARNGRDAVVFVIPDVSDVSLDFVTNPPDLADPVLVARLRDRSQVEAVQRLFPDRMPLLFNAHERSLELLPENPPGAKP